MNLPKQKMGYFLKNNEFKIISKDINLKDDEVLIKNLAIGLNPVDFKVQKQDNTILGVDGMGVAIAAKSPLININSRYAYHCDLRDDGSFADFSIIKAKALIPLSSNISDELAASLPCAGLTAMQSLQKVPNLKGEFVLVYGAGSMVGRILSSLLVINGAKVFAVCDKMHHEELLKSGVVECFDYKDKLKRKFKAIFDTTGKAEELLGNLEFYGHLVAILGRVEKNIVPIFTTAPSFHEIALNAIYGFGSDKDFANLVESGISLYELATQSKLLLPKIKIISFDEIPKALNELKSGVKGVKFVAKI